MDGVITLSRKRYEELYNNALFGLAVDNLLEEDAMNPDDFTETVKILKKRIMDKEEES